MISRLQPQRHRAFACITPYQIYFHTSIPLSALGKRPNIDAAAVSGCNSFRFWGKSSAVWYTSLGIFIAGLYHVLVNGPTRSAPTSTTEPLSPLHFTPLTLTASTPCTPYTKLLTLSLPSHLIPDEAERHIAPIFSIYVKDSDIQVERAYTPLHGIDVQGRMRFWVKRYEGGEVGRWLHERKVGDLVEVRGPIQNWDWQDGVWDEIIMISGGTGITPFFQLLHNAFSGATLPQTRFTLLHSSPTPLDLPPPELLDHLQALAQEHPGIFSLRLFVDTAESQALRQGLPKLGFGRIGRKAVNEALAHLDREKRPWWSRWSRWVWGPAPRVQLVNKSVLFLVCGPEPMTATIAGPRSRDPTQERVGGILGEMGYDARQVCKL